MDPLVSFLKDRVLSDDKGEAEKIRRKVPRFWLSEEQKQYVIPRKEKRKKKKKDLKGGVFK